MKQFLKKEKFTILSFTILLIWGISKIVLSTGYAGYYGGYEPINTNPIIMYFHLLTDMELEYIEILGPLFVFIPAIYEFHKELHTGYIKNCLTRVEYKKYMLKHYLKALSKCIILPLFVIILVFLCCIYLKSFDFNSQTDLYGKMSGTPNIFEYGSQIEFALTYLLNLLLHSILYVNLGLLFCKKFSNFLVNVILSFLSFIILEIVLEVFIGNYLLALKLNIHNITDSLNLFNVWMYDNVISLLFSIIFSLLLAALSTIMVIFIYKNKEGVLIESEK